MLRTRLNESLKTAMLAQDQRQVATLRLALAALKDRDIAERQKGNLSGLDDTQVAALLQSMIKQRRDSMVMYEQGGREDLVQQEAEEIEIIQKFLPEQLTDSEMEDVVVTTIREMGAQTLKDMGRVMAALKERYTGRMDFSKVGGLVKRRLT